MSNNIGHHSSAVVARQEGRATASSSAPTPAVAEQFDGAIDSQFDAEPLDDADVDLDLQDSEDTKDEHAFDERKQRRQQRSNEDEEEADKKEEIIAVEKKDKESNKKSNGSEALTRSQDALKALYAEDALNDLAEAEGDANLEVETEKNKIDSAREELSKKPSDKDNQNAASEDGGVNETGSESEDENDFDVLQNNVENNNESMQLPYKENTESLAGILPVAIQHPSPPSSHPRTVEAGYGDRVIPPVKSQHKLRKFLKFAFAAIILLSLAVAYFVHNYSHKDQYAFSFVSTLENPMLIDFEGLAREISLPVEQLQRLVTSNILVVSPIDQISIGIYYQPGDMPRPLILMRSDRYDQTMMLIAKQYGITVFEDSELARQLWRYGMQDQLIPLQSMPAVAKLMAQAKQRGQLMDK